MTVTPSGLRPYSTYNTTFTTAKLGVARAIAPSVVGEVLDTIHNTPVKYPLASSIPVNTLIDVEDDVPTVIKSVALPEDLQNASYYQIRVRGGSLQYTQADMNTDSFVLYWSNKASGDDDDGTETYYSLINFVNGSTITFNQSVPYSGPVGASCSTNEMLFNYYPQGLTDTLYWILSFDGAYPTTGLGAMTAITAINITITAFF
jgi:hypothetical protein